eukprot:CAMPEP_0172471414 /NCGR_PEP_ID=MMETSP1065-20121228/67805_1 /TAXON_ID=265537 /ORGANISM="Amphiprora paludosa, Strain CCMP125" /LENGTH=658 /DNA_ID=CAMNT_0013229509 /DNA_START=125 /DNA_END=2101 /DNA_ORIENTATION=+
MLAQNARRCLIRKRISVGGAPRTKPFLDGSYLHPSKSQPPLSFQFSTSNNPTIAFFSAQSQAKDGIKSRISSFFFPGNDDEISNPRLYRYLKLETFSEKELGAVFDRIRQQDELEDGPGDEPRTSDAIDLPMIATFFSKRLTELEDESDDVYDYDKDVQTMRQDFCNLESKRIWESIAKDAQTIKAANGGSSLQPVISNNAAITTSADALTDIFVSKQEFIEVLRNKASSVDLKRTWPITSSMILIGASVGVITPAMPFVVEQMGLNASEYGLIVSAFGLARMLGNVPSAVAIEKWGRRPFMIHSLSLIALGVGGIGWASTFEELYLCRLMTGVGVSLLGGAATLMVTDISTPLNRASTMAPVMSGFTAGTALGPAMGGVMVDSIGLAPTFYLVGASYLGVAAVNRAVLSETQRRPMKFAWRKKPTEPVANADDTLSGAVQNAVGQWAPLLKQRSVQSIMVMNASYWLALAGAQMTIMPLILTDQAGLNLSATELGQVYMGMSLIQIVGNPVFAKFIDKIGKAPAIVTGCTLISLPMAAMPLCQDWMQLAGVCGLWACGSSMMSTAPLAYMSDKVAESERAQSIALLRTCGDMGFLVGASAIGALADWAGSLDHGMQTSAGLLLTATAWFGARQLIFVQPDTSRNPKGEKIDDNTKSP